MSKAKKTAKKTESERQDVSITPITSKDLESIQTLVPIDMGSGNRKFFHSSSYTMTIDGYLVTVGNNKTLQEKVIPLSNITCFQYA